MLGSKSYFGAHRMRLFFVCFFLNCLLPAGAHATVFSCGNANWIYAGYLKGYSGSLSTTLADIKKTCASSIGEEGVRALEQGYKIGLSDYCTPEEAYYQGRTDRTYQGVCSGAASEAFLAAFEAGKKALFYERTLIVLGYVISVVVLLFFFFYRRKIKESPFDELSFRQTPYTFCLFLGGAALAVGAALRLGFINIIGSGNYMYEEMSAGLIYIDKMLVGEHTLSGATNMTFFLVMALWQFFCGPSVLSLRVLSTLVAGLGLIFLFLGVRRLISKSTALLTVGLAGLSLYWSHLSRMGMETSWPLTFFSVSLYLYAKILDDRQSRFLPFVLGLIVALGSFTYPAFNLWLAAMVPFIVLGMFNHIKRTEIIFFSCGFLLLVVPNLIFHRYYQQGAALFTGGGVAFIDGDSFVSSLRTQFRDLFVVADSYYLDQGFPFLESALFGFFILGAWRLVYLERRGWSIALFGSMAIMPLLSAIASNLPGIRRAVVMLAIFYLFSGVGVTTFLESFVRNRKLGYSICVASVLVCLLGVLHSLSLSQRMPTISRYAELPTNELFNSWLANENLAIAVTSFDGSDLIPQFFKAYAHLLQRQTGVPAQNFSVLTEKEGYLPKDIREKEKYLVVLSTVDLVKAVESNFCVANNTNLETSRGPLYLLEIRRCMPVALGVFR
jgi:hypothetical protein